MALHDGDHAGTKDSYNVAEHNGYRSDLERDSPTQDGYEDLWGDSHNDKRDMRRLGKKQEFKRNFNTLSALGFVCVYMVCTSPITSF